MSSDTLFSHFLKMPRGQSGSYRWWRSKRIAGPGRIAIADLDKSVVVGTAAHADMLMNQDRAPLPTMPMLPLILRSLPVATWMYCRSGSLDGLKGLLTGLPLHSIESRAMIVDCHGYW